MKINDNVSGAQLQSIDKALTNSITHSQKKKKKLIHKQQGQKGGNCH